METRRQPCLKSLSQRGYIQGVTLCDKSTDNPLCHYFGGLRYGLPPAQRWRKARKLPSTYTYGTEDHPCPCEGPAGVCPQPSFLNLSKENGWSEDCFQCNVWVPWGEPPKEGTSIYVPSFLDMNCEANGHTSNQDGRFSSSSVCCSFSLPHSTVLL